MSINKKSPTDMVISNFAKKVEGINTPPPLSHLQYLQCHLDLQKRYYTNPYILSIKMGTKSVSLQ